MIYIQKDWIIDKENESTIYAILEKYLRSDVNLDVEPAIKELTDIGETIIVEKIKDGLIMADS